MQIETASLYELLTVSSRTVSSRSPMGTPDASNDFTTPRSPVSVAATEATSDAGAVSVKGS